MRTIVSSLRAGRPWIAGMGLVGLAALLSIRHAPQERGLSADELTPEFIAAAAEEARAEGQDVGPENVWLVDFVEPDEGEGGSDEDIAELVESINLEAGRALVEPAGFYSEGEHLFRVTDADALAQLADHPLVEGWEPLTWYSLPEAAAVVEEGDIAPSDGAEPNKRPRFEPDDPMFRLQWHMEQIRAPEAWTRGTGKGAVVAVIDTGVAYKNSGNAKMLPDLAGTSFTDGESFIRGLPEGLDDHAHGSHVAGTIAQTTNNGIGVTGVAYEATIMPLKVLSKEGRGAVDGIANAIRYAADHGANVINMSLGGPLPSRVLAKAIEYAHGKGVTTVCAAGNERRSKVGYPAANKYAVAVSAVDYERNLSFYSNWGADIDVAAPGGDTRSDKNGDGHPDGVLQNTIVVGDPSQSQYAWFQGTSMASPHAAGVAALIVGQGVTNPDEVERIMKETAAHPGGKKWDDRYGAGIVDAAAAAEGAKSEHAPERFGVLALLALMGLGGIGLAGLSGRARWIGIGGAVVGAVAAAGAWTAPVAYGLAGLTGGFGGALTLSAALPVLATVLLFGQRPLRGMLVGFSLGYAAMLLHGAIVLPTLVDGVPGGPVIDRLWLAAHAAIAFALARRVARS